MKKAYKYLYVNILILGMSSYLSTQNEANAQEPGTTRYTEDVYDYVKDRIQRNKYYVNEFKLNSRNLPWVQGKNYQNTQQYYYSFVGDNTPVLRMIMVITKMEDRNYYTEYLYNNEGEMIFCYEKQNDQKAHEYREIKAYFEKDLCVNIVLDDAILEIEKIPEHRTALRKMKEQGKEYAQRFIMDMQTDVEK